MATETTKVNASTDGETNSENKECDETDILTTKEKTPLCLLNELIRHNKVKHKYTLIDEQGPAHQKTFFIRLTIGNEEYSAKGQSIKKAQHQAALMALKDTKLQHPQPKQKDKLKEINSTITPTVMLNSLAMGSGIEVSYEAPEKSRTPIKTSLNNNSGRNYNKVHYYVTVHVGDYQFMGNGSTRQDARHSAALKALTALKDMLQVKQKKKEQQVSTDTDDYNKEVLKSEISVVHEIALKKELTVKFELVRESGPPHMKTFITRCTMGDIEAEGQGSGKKVSKKQAAVNMLELLNSQEENLPVTFSYCKKSYNKNNKNRRKQAIKIQRADPNYGANINPISRLIQIQDAQKAPEPTYKLIDEKGNPPHREFVMQIEMDGHVCTGIGPNKKLAKRSAAESMLSILGLNKTTPTPAKSSIKQSEGSSDKKVTFIDQNGQHDSVILQPINPFSHFVGPNGDGSVGISSNQVNNALNTTNDTNTTAAIAKELLDQGTSPTAERVRSSQNSQNNVPTADKSHSVQQIVYLAQVLNVAVQFNEFPKDNNEILSLVTLSTNPPHVSHGTGSTKEQAQNNAAIQALTALSNMATDRN